MSVSSDASTHALHEGLSGSDPLPKDIPKHPVPSLKPKTRFTAPFGSLPKHDFAPRQTTKCRRNHSHQPATRSHRRLTGQSPVTTSCPPNLGPSPPLSPFLISDLHRTSTAIVLTGCTVLFSGLTEDSENRTRRLPTSTTKKLVPSDTLVVQRPTSPRVPPTRRPRQQTQPSSRPTLTTHVSTYTLYQRVVVEQTHRTHRYDIGTESLRVSSS